MQTEKYALHHSTVDFLVELKYLPSLQQCKSCTTRGSTGPRLLLQQQQGGGG